jgi:hypothetical protein
MKTSWKPHEKHGHLTRQSNLPDTVFAFPKQRKEPLTVTLSESSWRDVGVHPQTFTTERKIKTVETRRRDKRARKRT